MKWFSSSKAKRNSHHKENLCAVVVALSAVTILYFSHDPSPAGANPSELQFDSADLTASMSSSANFSEKSGGGKESGELTGENAMLMQILLLEKGQRFLSTVPDYTSTLYKQERIDGVLNAPSFMQVKIRHEPFSVYMKWLEGDDPGRELLYVEGENDDEMLIKLGGVKGRMMPTLKLNPTGDMAMKEARYPVTTIGLRNVIKTILGFRYTDLNNMNGMTCRMIDKQKWNKEDCFCFLMEYQNKQSSNFRKSILYVEKKNYLPICVKNYSWAPDGRDDLTGEKLDEETLCEFYSFSNIVTEDRLASTEFDESNSSYQFRR